MWFTCFTIFSVYKDCFHFIIHAFNSNKKNDNDDDDNDDDNYDDDYDDSDDNGNDDENENKTITQKFYE